MEYYLSALFYFNQQGFIFDFLLPKTILEKQLLIETINVSENQNFKKIANTAGNAGTMNVIFEKNEDEKEEEKKEEDNKKGHLKQGSALDLGDQNCGFFGKADGKNGFSNKTHALKKQGVNKKKATNTITCAEFQLKNNDKKK